MAQAWVIAIGLVLILEGIGPFLFPKQWRQAFEAITRMSNGQIRFFGMVALLLGLLVITIF